MDGAGLGAGTLCLSAPGDVTSQPLSVPDVRGASGLSLSSLSVLDLPCDRPCAQEPAEQRRPGLRGWELQRARAAGVRGGVSPRSRAGGLNSCHSPVTWFSCMVIFPSFSSASFSSPPSLPSWTLSLDPTNQTS